MERKSGRLIAADYLSRAESVVLVLIAIVLAIVALLLLWSSLFALVEAVTHGTMRESAIEILDSVLLVMMTMEIVYTVTVSLESHTLVAEPFLIIGAIAAIRRMLVITAESAKFESTPEAFRSLQIELGVLAFIVIAMTVSIYVMRRSQQFITPSQEGKTE